MTECVLSCSQVHLKAHIGVKLTFSLLYDEILFFAQLFFLRFSFACEKKFFKLSINFKSSFARIFQNWQSLVFTWISFYFWQSSCYLFTFNPRNFQTFSRQKRNSLFSSTMNVKFLFHVRLGKMRRITTKAFAVAHQIFFSRRRKFALLRAF